MVLQDLLEYRQLKVPKISNSMDRAAALDYIVRMLPYDTEINAFHRSSNLKSWGTHVSSINNGVMITLDPNHRNSYLFPRVVRELFPDMVVPEFVGRDIIHLEIKCGDEEVRLTPECASLYASSLNERMATKICTINANCHGDPETPLQPVEYSKN